MIKGRTYDTRMYNTLTVDESVKKDVSTEKEDSNSGVDENPQFQSPLKESA